MNEWRFCKAEFNGSLAVGFAASPLTETEWWQLGIPTLVKNQTQVRPAKKAAVRHGLLSAPVCKEAVPWKPASTIVLFVASVKIFEQKAGP